LLETSVTVELALLRLGIALCVKTLVEFNSHTACLVNTTEWKKEIGFDKLGDLLGSLLGCIRSDRLSFLLGSSGSSGSSGSRGNALEGRGGVSLEKNIHNALRVDVEFGCDDVCDGVGDGVHFVIDRF
jgi:hypothetical protein